MRIKAIPRPFVMIALLFAGLLFVEYASALPRGTTASGGATNILLANTGVAILVNTGVKLLVQ